MVEACDGISLQNQTAMAPLYAALLAEDSLAWRRQKFKEVEETAKELEDADYGHHLFAVAAGRTDEGFFAERESIKRSDIFGKPSWSMLRRRGLTDRLIHGIPSGIIRLTSQAQTPD